MVNGVCMVLDVSWRLRLGMLMLVVSGFDLQAQMMAAGPRTVKSDAEVQNENVQPSTTLTVTERSPGAEALLKGQKAFSNGNLKKALALYKEAAEADPKLYEAALFAGSTEFKMKNYDEACTWYAKAIAINPDRETAYRIWGDALMQKGEQKTARSKFVDAVIAEPYTKS